MSILTSIAKQLLILDDKLHCRFAEARATLADQYEQKATKAYTAGIAQVKQNVKAAQAEGAALVAEAEAAVRRAKAQQVQLVADAEAQSVAVEAHHDALCSKSGTCHAKGVQHVLRSQKAREAAQIL